MKDTKGNTLVVGLALGLIVLAGTTTAIYTASKTKTNVLSDESSKQSLAIAEAGINNILAQLTDNQELLTKTYDPDGFLGSTLNEWTTPTPGYGVNSCSNITTEMAANSIERKGSVGTGSSSGTFVLLAYRYNEPLGRILVQGNLNKQPLSRSQLLVEFPVTIEPSGNGIGSALMASEFNMRQSDAITSSIVCTDPTKCKLLCSGDSPTTSNLRDSLGATPNSKIVSHVTGKATEIKIASVSIPPIPPPPSNIISLGDITKNVTLPRAGDKPTPGTQTYYYQIHNWDKSSILTDPDADIRLYVSGNVTQAGNDDLRPTNSTPKPGQIRVYGNSTTTQDWLLSGNACTMAFIHAPNANVGISGGGNGCPDTGTNIYGAVWALSYNVIGNPSNSSMFYEQPGLMEAIGTDGLPSFQTVRAGPPTSWIRTPVLP